MGTLQYNYGLNVEYISQYATRSKESKYINIELTPQLGDSFEKKEKKLKNLNKGFRQSKELSATSKKKITNGLQWLDFVAKNKVYITKKGKRITWRLQMITLTLSSQQQHEDKEITKKILGEFLNEMRNNYNFRNYIWKAETQKNGNIHYHIITDADINYYRVLYTWNRCQNYLGYIDRYTMKTGETNPNSVDLKKIYNQSKIANYIAKYLGKKDDKRRLITSRLYAMSLSLSRLQEFKKECKDLAEFAYHVAKSHLRCEEIRKEYSNYVPISIKRICAFYKDFEEELKYRLKEFAKLTASEFNKKMHLDEFTLLQLSANFNTPTGR